MDIILLIIGAWWLCGICGCRKRKPKPRKRKKFWYDSSYNDWNNNCW